VALIFATADECKKARQVFKIPAQLGFAVDFLIYDKKRFREKLQSGGICELIEKEGRVVYPTNLPVV
jgi:hypothetical protein